MVAAYLAQSAPNDPIPGQCPPTKDVGVTRGPADAMGGVVGGAEVAGLAGVSKAENDTSKPSGEPTVTRPARTAAAVAAHSDTILSDPRIRRGISPFDIIEIPSSSIESPGCMTAHTSQRVLRNR